ncbi:XRE family transcriptional regulator [Rhodopirellula maiorica SM1]|uniref:XRE family transcriptional regulator n=1 Tax=Rhodopirellula maiorica SM1 TaxID=1265738 RepID=M5RJZ2_9BACT|nr:helix-turn-helix transcriptional regulator [Rhodopirellula maiorica]EMI15697.1 XRE family transcriptional regulator [Rhodopirellula maiorica SM1]
MAKKKKQTFGERLREARVAKGYSLRKFSIEVDVSPTYLSQVEQGKVAPPTADRVERIAALLEESVDEWMALADRLPDELPDIIHGDPGVPDLLRAVKGMSPEQIKRLREAADEIREDKGKYK